MENSSLNIFAFFLLFFFQISEFNEQKSMVQSRTGIITGEHKNTKTVWAIPLQSRIVKFMNC